jgi:alcohol dehydrogenase class IV
MPLPELFEFLVAARILYGPGTVKETGFEVQKLGGSRVFLVTDRVLEQAGLAERAIRGLDGAADLAGVFADVPPNSEVSVVERGAAAALAAGCDLLLAVGGGSVIDTAKAVNLLVCQGGSLLDYEGAGLITHPLLPLIAIPTTAGSGSEVSIGAVIRDEARGLKLELNSRFMAPDVAILDPELTLTMPPGLTAATGLDALTHAVESYLSTNAQPLGDALALAAVRMIAANLRQAVWQGDDLEARANMLLASNMAGIAMNNALLGIVHAMAHPCSGHYGVAHGLVNAILLPYGMEFNLPVAASRLAGIAAALGVDTHGLDTDRAARAGIACVRPLAHDCCLPDRLSQSGVPHSGLAQLAADALGDGMLYTNPRLPSEEDILALYRQAF